MRNQTLARSLGSTPRMLLPLLAYASLSVFAFVIAQWMGEGMRSRFETETKTRSSGDVTVQWTAMPDDTLRQSLKSAVGNMRGTYSEAVSVSYLASYGSGKTQALDIRAVDSAYPLYGAIRNETPVRSSPNLPLGARMGKDTQAGASGSLSLFGREYAVRSRFDGLPDESFNPFSAGVPVLLPLDTFPLDELKTGYRYEYAFNVRLPNGASVTEARDELRSLVGDGKYRVRINEMGRGDTWRIFSTFSDSVSVFFFVSAVLAVATYAFAFFSFLRAFRRRLDLAYLFGMPKSRSYRVFAGRFVLSWIFAATAAPIAIVFFAWPWISSLASFDTSFLPIAVASLVYSLVLLAVSLFAAATDVARDAAASRFRYAFAIRPVLAVSAFAVAYAAPSYEWMPVFSRPLALCVFGVVLLEWAFFSRPLESFALAFSRRSFLLREAFRSFFRSSFLSRLSFSVFFFLSFAVVFLAAFSALFLRAVSDVQNGAIDAFVLNLKPSDVDKVQAVAKGESYAIVKARIVSISGRSLEEHFGSEPSREFTREFNLTDSALSDRILRWTAKLGSGQTSIDEQFASQLGVDLGDTVTFSFGGISERFEIASVRESSRSGVRPFFYFQLPPLADGKYPKTVFFGATSVRTVPDWKERVLAVSGPYVSFIEVGPILDELRSYVRLVMLAVSAMLAYVAFFALLALRASATAFFRSQSDRYSKYSFFGLSVGRLSRLARMESFLAFVLPFVSGSLLAGAGLAWFIGANPFLRFDLGSFSILAVSILSVTVLGLLVAVSLLRPSRVVE